MSVTIKRTKSRRIIGTRSWAVKGNSVAGSKIGRRGIRATYVPLRSTSRTQMSVKRLSFDEKIDASRILTAYSRRNVLDIGSCTHIVKEFVNSIIANGQVKTQLQVLNRVIVNENMKINKPTEETIRAYNKLMAN